MEQPAGSALATVIDEDLAHQIIEDATDYAILTLDEEGRVTSWSPGAARILGYSAEEAIGMDVGALFLDADRVAGLHTAELEKAQTEGRAEDTRWHVRKSGELFWANGVCMRRRNGDGLLKVMRDETPAKLAEDQRVLLLNELNHRLRNTLVTVQSIVDSTLRARGIEVDVRDVVMERLMTLAEAHSLLVEQNWAGADLHEIVRRALEPHEQPGRARIRTEGAPVRLSPTQAVAMALALHELATNAVKYGALSTLDGEVRISWNLSYESDGARRMVFAWCEAGGPKVVPPTRQGFGTRLISQSFRAIHGNRVNLDYRVDGLQCVIEVMLSSAAELPILAIRGDPSARPT